MSPAARLSLKAHLTAVPLADSHILLLGEAERHLLQGPVFARLVGLLDGARTADEIVSALAPEMPPEIVYHALAILEREGHIADGGSTGLKRDKAAFWHAIGADPRTAGDRLAATRVAVLALGDTHCHLPGLLSALGRAGIAATDDPAASDAALTIVMVDDYLDARLAAVNAAALRHRRAWLLVKPRGRQPALGPLFTPGAGACWECLARRLRDNRREENAAAASADAIAPRVLGAVVAEPAVMTPLAATQAAIWLARGENQALRDAITTIDMVSLASRRHALQRRPRCEACGEPAAHRPVLHPDALHELPPLRLRCRPKRFTEDGGHRICRPEETIARLAPLVSPLSGIIPELRQSSEAGPFALYDARQITPWRPGRPGLDADPSLGAGGKGMTDAEARAGCMAEAVERYNCTFQGDEAWIVASRDELGADAVHPDSILGYSPQQYATRDRWNEGREGDYFWIPAPFDPRARIAWTPAWSLTASRHRWLPSALCYYDFPHGDGEVFGRATSNGCAAGNVVEEAILQGIVELVERDAVAIWWYNRLRRPRFPLEALPGAVAGHVAGLAEHCAGEGRTLELLDLTTDLGIPVAGAVSWRAAEGDQIGFGFGAHLDPAIAVSRAASELCQTLAYNRRVRSMPLGRKKAHVERWERTATIATEPYLVPDPEARAAPHSAPAAQPDVRDDIDACVALLRDQGLETLVVDMTRPDLDFPTVRVVVPGLRHYHNRFAPGRLYDVPVKLGWRPRPCPEGCLNPVPFFG
jgi:ribosomal protein S12 methylthiotransferase accessory factor